ncbi:MAG TPA: arginine--tRNA ligase [Candidatus Saccharimonadales bacterium]|nr:arginine--tRNA ligase [Candidatus Saccharimonadales bacterium]
MTFLESLKNKIIAQLGAPALVFSYPPNSELGDLSLACFEPAKKENISPVELAKKWAEKISQNQELALYFIEVRPVGPYLNFFISPSLLATEIVAATKKEKDNYGRNDSGHQQQIMIEYSNGNTHKEYHVGHLRNIAYGDAINRLLDANGFKSIPVSYINDFGIHVAKTIWNWKKNPAYAHQTEPKGFLLGKCYADASQKLTDRPEYKLEVTKIMQEIESRSGDNYALWKETRNWSIDYFASIYKELDIKFEKIFYESEVIDEGLEMVNTMLNKNILVKSEGAIIANLEKYDLGILPIIRSDGTALYPVADLALAVNKFSLYNLVESIYIVDVRQSLHFKQLFKVLELLGYSQRLTHLPYDFVTLPGGMMSSRTGNVITYEELKTKIRARLLSETKSKHEDWTDEQVTKVVDVLTIAIIKFEMLKVSADKIITFNIEESLKFDGYTACYLEYSYARLQSILRKESGVSLLGKIDFSMLTEKKEAELLMKVAKYPEIIILASTKRNPSELTRYLFELAQLSNDYYHAVNILKADKKIKKARLALIKTVSQVLKNGLHVLGLETLEEM